MLTHRQKEIHDFLRKYVRKHGVVPTYEEIRSHFGFRSYNAVFKHLKQLEARGYLSSRWKNRKQAYRLKEWRGRSKSVAGGGRKVRHLG